MDAPARLGTIVGGTRYSDPATKEIRHSIDLLDLDAGPLGAGRAPDRIPLDFLAHGFAPHPRRSEAALLEKRGPGGCHVDLVARAVIRPIAPMEGHHFYGHGAFTRDAGAFLAVESQLGTGEGAISVRDPVSFAVIDTFPTYGKAPHDCVLIEDGATLAVTNGGGPFGTDALPCVTFVDVASRKLLEKREVSSPRINAGHVAITMNRAFVLVSAPRDGLAETDLGGVSLGAESGLLRRVTRPEQVTGRMIGESLSVCIHHRTRTAVVTHPYAHLISFWNLGAGALFGAFDLPHPRGVTLTLDERYFAVSFGPAASLLLIETEPLKPRTDLDCGARIFGGSHIYTWAAA